MTRSRIALGAGLAISMTLAAACGGSDEADTSSEPVGDTDATEESVVEEDTSSDGEASSPLVSGVTFEEVEAAAGNAELSTFLSALEVAGFDEVVSAEFFTFLAPSDAAFAAVDADLLAELLADPEQLRGVLRNHVFDLQLGASSLPRSGSFVSLGGLELAFDLSNPEPMVNGATITQTDIVVGERGVIHVIDGVLLGS